MFCARTGQYPSWYKRQGSYLYPTDHCIREKIKICADVHPTKKGSTIQGARWQDYDERQLPPGHILGPISPSPETRKVSWPDVAVVSKSAAKNTNETPSVHVPRQSRGNDQTLLTPMH